jgi:hypothetical protein
LGAQVPLAKLAIDRASKKNPAHRQGHLISQRLI